MKTSGVALGLCVFAVTVFAQSGRGIIIGTITDPDGGAVAGAAVHAKNTSSGMLFNAASLADGNFTIPDLPAGTYELSVPAIGFTFVPYVRKDVLIQQGQTLRADIRLEWPGNLGTLGDDTFLTIRNRYAGLAGPAPRTPDGKPDLSGIWNGTPDPNPGPPSPLPWASAIAKKRIEDYLKDTPTAYCLPDGVFPGAPLLYKIVQTPALLVQLFELEPHFRQVFLDGSAHPKDPDPTWQGHSVGSWEGDTLVVDTVGYNDKSWLPDALPHTEKLHVIERYHRSDLAHLAIDVMIEDPGTLMKPWQHHMVWSLAPGEEIMESICAENNQYSGHPVSK